MILPDWWWHTAGRHVLAPSDPKRINPVSVDLTLSHEVRLQRYRGLEYDDVRAVLYNERDQYKMNWALMIDDPDARDVLFANGTKFSDQPFIPGDSVLASTEQYLRVPRYVRIQGMLKSSTARAGLNHRTALYVDPGFHGHLTLELVFDRSGFLIPRKPILQVEACIALPWRPYRGHYQGQGHSQPNRNLHDLGFRPSTGPYPYEEPR